MRLGDLDALKEQIKNDYCKNHCLLPYGEDYCPSNCPARYFIKMIDNAPTVDIKDQIAGAYNEGYMCGNKEAEKARPQGEFTLNELKGYLLFYGYSSDAVEDTLINFESYVKGKKGGAENG